MSSAYRTAHEKSHQRADDRLNRLKWPWEREEDGGVDDAMDPNEQNFSNKDLYYRYKYDTADNLNINFVSYFCTPASNRNLIFWLLFTYLGVKRSEETECVTPVTEVCAGRWIH